MTSQEAAALLTVAAAFDNRKPDADAAQAWALALGDLPFADCRNAIIGHYRKTSDWLMPSHVIDAVRRVRDKRIAEHEAELAPPPEAREGAAMHAWLTQAKRRLGDGEPVEAVTYVDPELRTRRLSDLRLLMPSPALHPTPETPTNPEAASVAEEASHG